MSVWPGRLARAGSGILVLGAVSAVGVAAWLAPVPEDVAVDAATIPVPAGPTTLVCPGPVVLPEADDEGDPEFNPAPVGSVDRLRLVAGAGADGAGGVAGSTGGALLEAWPLDALAGAPVLVADATGITADLGGAEDLGGADGVTAVGESLAVVGAEHTSGVVARAQPVVELAPRVAGAVVSTVAAGDLRGTAAASCQRPGSEFWLVGGGTELGTTTLLVVHNPGATPAEIGLAMWGPAGPVELGGGARYIVPSGGELTLRLSALAAELARTVVHVTSAGGQIAAFLQVSELDGFTPGGTDLVVPGVEPVLRQVLTSLVVPESELEGPGAGLLRLLVPGTGPEGGGASDDDASDASDAPDGEESDAAESDGAGSDGSDPDGVGPDEGDSDGTGSGSAGSDDAGSSDDISDGESEELDAPRLQGAEVPVRVVFYGESGPVVLPGTEELTLVPGEVTDVDLGGLPAGAYAVVIDADAPVLAGARVERPGTPASPGDPVPVEQAWISASPRPGADLIAVPAGLTADAVISGLPAPTAPTGEPDGLATGRLRTFDETGAVISSEEVSVPAGTTLSVPLPQGTAAVELIPTSDASNPEDTVTAGSSLAWGLFVTSQGADGALVSVLTSPGHGSAVGQVGVRQAQRLPLE